MMRKANGHGEAFWRFSLALYARRGVADALIGIQDRSGHDVNLVLFGLWLGATRGRRLGAAELTAVSAAAAPINSAVVAPLRALRRLLKPASDSDAQALRQRIAGLELAAERRVQHRLAACFVAPPCAEPAAVRLAAAEANLARVLGGDAQSSEADTVRQALAALIRHPWPG